MRRRRKISITSSLSGISSLSGKGEPLRGETPDSDEIPDSDDVMEIFNLNSSLHHMLKHAPETRVWIIIYLII